MKIESYNSPKTGEKMYSCRFWYNKNGEQKSKYKGGFRKKKDAEKWGSSEKDRLERTHGNSDKLTLEEFLNRWLPTREGKLSPCTMSGYDVNVRHINRLIGGIPLSRLETIDIQELADKLTEEGKKKKTVQYVLRTLHVALEYAVTNKYILSNPNRNIEIADDEEEFTASILSADDMANLLSLLKEQEHYLYIPVLLACMRGLRRGECLGLRWEDLDEENDLLYIRKNYVKVKRINYHKKLKSKDSMRNVSIAGVLKDELLFHKEMLKNKGIISPYICVMDDGQLPVPSHISRGLKSFQKANGLPLCRLHDLRHSFAMLQLEYGTDLDTLRRLLGHSKISVTSNYYLHQNMTLIKAASVKMDAKILKKENNYNSTTISEKAK